MINDDWTPRSNEGRYDNSDSRERRSYNSDRNDYGYNNQGGNYGRPDRGNDRPRNNNYDRPQRPYNSQGGGYNRPQRSYDQYSGGNYDRPQRSYEQQRPLASSEDGGIRKRRPRVGESSSRNNNYGGNYGGGNSYNNNNGDRRYNGGGYDRDNRGDNGYNNNRGGGYNNYNNNGGGGYNRNYSRPNGGGRPQQGDNRGSYNPNAKYSLQKQLKYREENFDPDELLRLNKYLANAGVCSRREADDFIKAGVVKVNDEVVTELGTKVKRSDVVSFQEKPIQLEHKVYVLLNKPKNCVTTADDPQERLTVMDLVKNACHERIFPVGRLDRNTTGVLLLTNDGDLASKLTHPKFLKKKIYHVWLDKDVEVEDMQKLADGITLDDGEIHADAISYVGEEGKDQVGIEIHSGKNRIVRRMFESLGYKVMRLDRVYFAGLTKKNLKRGKWRFLSEKEVSMLRMGAFE
ncbi:23S rRNA pseudouridine2605 synthase [Dysgonomonadaceae bacterium PH5-43]|nr:23S rRNA pseudouridine2605 synthase [Dysgonomonadaceae bacterium PH5-43]